jgi:mRNA-degrading endonuclease toxin of MazEF toxin-antitoxin module
VGINPDLAAKLGRVGLSDREILCGQVYQIPDRRVSFPETEEQRSQGKGTHDSRYAVVVQGDESLSDPTNLCVLVVPTTTRGAGAAGPKPRFAIPLSCGDGNLPRDCLALADMVQPILKTDLTHYCGSLTPKKFEEIQTVLLVLLGHLSPST